MSFKFVVNTNAVITDKIAAFLKKKVVGEC